MGARSYSEATRKALFALSLGRCYEPSCQEQVVRMANDGTPVVLVQIAHIRAATAGGPRYDSAMKDNQRRAFANLLLLCTFHHQMVDKKPTGLTFTTSQLTAWKAARESGLADGLQGLDEEHLIEALSSTLEEVILDTKAELLEAIGEVEDVSRESAGLLRTLVRETFRRPHLDPEAVASLANSAHALQGVTDYAPMLRDSARSLGNTLPEYGGMLMRSSQNLRELPDFVGVLARAASDLKGAAEWVGGLQRAAQGLAELPGHTAELMSACEAALNSADELRRAAVQAEQAGSVNAAHMSNAAYTVSTAADDVRQAAATTAAVAVGNRPDGLSLVLRGMAAGFLLACLIAAAIWYVVTHKASPAS